MPQIEIHQAKNDDIPILIKINHSYETNYVWQMERYQDTGDISIGFREIRLPRSVKVEYPRSPENLTADLPERSALLAASINHNLVGYIALVEQTATRAAWITDLIIDTEYRRHGIASALVISAHEWAARRHLRWITIEMQSKNHPAICLANKLGYEFCGFNDHYYSNQDIVLFFGYFIR